MQKTLFSICSLAALAGCGETVQTTGGGGSGQIGNFGIPEVLADDLVAANYNATAQTITLELDGFDGPTDATTFSRAASLDYVSPDGTTTYYAFRTQTTPSNRVYVAFAAAGDHTQAGITATEGEHGSSFGGAFYEPTSATATNIPTQGSAIFRGGYRGLWKAGAGVADRATLTTGQVLFSVNLTEGQVEGTIFDKFDVDAATAMPDVSLKATALEAGTFQGEAYIGPTRVGDYGGIVAGSVSNTSAGANGGTSPAEVAGVGVYKPYVTDVPIEYGVFILPVCGGPSEASTCP